MKRLLNKISLPLVFILGISFTVFVSIETNKWISENEKARFNLASKQAILLLKNRLDSNIQLLLSLRGLFDATKQVSREEFNSFFATQNIKNRFPGIKAFGYSPIIAPNEKTLFEMKVQEEGIKSFKIFPESKNQIVPIYYLYPFTKYNKKALGYDMASNETRSIAMNEAVEKKAPIISNKIELIQQNEDRAGFVIYMPILKTGENSDILEGFIYTAVNSERLFNDLFGARFLPIDIEIYDGFQATQNNLLYDSNTLLKNPSLSSIKNLNLYGRDWVLHIKSEGALDMGATKLLPWIEFIFGSFLTFVSAGWIFALKRTQKRAQDIAEDMLKTVQEQMKIIDENVIISETDIKGIITKASAAYSKISGYSKNELVGKSHAIVRHPDTPKSLYDSLWTNIKSGKEWRGEIKNRHKDGSHYWVDALIVPKYNENGKIAGYTSIRQDITDKKRIEEISIKDTLTGIYNRLRLDELFKTFLNISLRHKTPFSIIILDIDNFKLVNDNFGHQVGDTVLKEFAQILLENIRAEDSVGRWGGEEFLILAPGSDLIAAKSLAEKLRKIVENFNFTTVGTKTASFGISTCHKNDDEKSMVFRADEALYLAKNSGRNQVQTETNDRKRP